MHGDLCKHLGIDTSTDHPDRYSNLFLNAYINRYVHSEWAIHVNTSKLTLTFTSVFLLERLLQAGLFPCQIILLSDDNFSENKIFQKKFGKSNSLDPDQVRHFIGPDLGTNCLQWLSAEDISRQNSNESSF